MKSTQQNFEFLSWDDSSYKHFLVHRKGEKRLGEMFSDINQAKFVVLGIEESHGPRANYGSAGAEGAFDAFCSKFLNMQSTNSLRGDQISFLGSIKATTTTASDLTLAVEELDDFVCQVVNKFVLPHQVLIVIGGGHNSAFPIIKSCSDRFDSQINCINLDAHADYRVLEGRHSGNPFSYAYDRGFMHKYFVLGLHQRYNNEATINGLIKDKHYFTFFEDYIDGVKAFVDDIDVIKTELTERNLPFGIELDMDAIAYMPSSAMSPSGFSVNDARFYIRKMVSSGNCCYLHLPEAAPQNDNEVSTVGKALSYLVSDFISCYPFISFQR